MRPLVQHGLQHQWFIRVRQRYGADVRVPAGLRVPFEVEAVVAQHVPEHGLGLAALLVDDFTPLDAVSGFHAEGPLVNGYG